MALLVVYVGAIARDELVALPDTGSATSDYTGAQWIAGTWSFGSIRSRWRTSLNFKWPLGRSEVGPLLA